MLDFFSDEARNNFIKEMRLTRPIESFGWFLVHLIRMPLINRSQFAHDYIHLISSREELILVLLNLPDQTRYSFVLELTKQKKNGLLKAEDLPILCLPNQYSFSIHIRLGWILAMFEPSEWLNLFVALESLLGTLTHCFNNLDEIALLIQSVSDISMVPDVYFIQLISYLPYDIDFQMQLRGFCLTYEDNVYSILKQCWESQLADCYSGREIEAIISGYLTIKIEISCLSNMRKGYTLHCSEFSSQNVLQTAMKKLQHLTHEKIKSESFIGMFSGKSIILPMHPRDLVMQIIASQKPKERTKCTIM